MPALPQPPLAPTATLTPAQGTPSMDELIQQSQWSLQQQEQHLLALRQVCLHLVPVTPESPSSRPVTSTGIAQLTCTHCRCHNMVA